MDSQAPSITVSSILLCVTPGTCTSISLGWTPKGNCCSQWGHFPEKGRIVLQQGGPRLYSNSNRAVSMSVPVLGSCHPWCLAASHTLPSFKALFGGTPAFPLICRSVLSAGQASSSGPVPLVTKQCNCQFPYPCHSPGRSWGQS